MGCSNSSHNTTSNVKSNESKYKPEYLVQVNVDHSSCSELETVDTSQLDITMKLEGDDIDSPQKTSGKDLEACSEFLDACKKGLLDSVIKLSVNCDVNCTDEFGRTGLHLAAGEGRSITCSKLVEIGAHIDTRDCLYNNTALLCAATGGKAETCKTLLELGANIKAHDKYGKTALLCSVQGDHIELALMLLNKGANLNAVDSNGSNALMAAAAAGRKELAAKLLELGANVNATDKFGRSALLHAAQAGLVKLCDELLRRKADIRAADSNGRTALLLAAGGGHSVLCERLLALGADVNAQDHEGMTVLLCAAESGHTELCAKLLSAGASVNACTLEDKSTALHLACRYGHLRTALLLLDHMQAEDVQTRNAEGCTSLDEWDGDIVGRQQVAARLRLLTGAPIDAGDWGEDII